MTARGRHARSGGAGFYRDVLFLVAGILVVGAIVFGGLSLWAGGSDDDPSTPPASPSSTEGETTQTMTTILPVTTTVPSTTRTDPPPLTTTTAPPPESTLREARPPGETRVVVLNSTDATGLAGSLSQELAQIGYQMAQADNYTPELSDSMIFHADGFSVEAIDLSESVPDATVAPDPELAAEWGVDVVVVIGRSYQE